MLSGSRNCRTPNFIKKSAALPRVISITLSCALSSEVRTSSFRMYVLEGTFQNKPVSPILKICSSLYHLSSIICLKVLRNFSVAFSLAAAASPRKEEYFILNLFWKWSNHPLLVWKSSMYCQWSLLPLFWCLLLHFLGGTVGTFLRMLLNGMFFLHNANSNSIRAKYSFLTIDIFLAQNLAIAAVLTDTSSFFFTKHMMLFVGNKIATYNRRTFIVPEKILKLHLALACVGY